MVRWAPDARERLERAALELFDERGYDQTSVAQIADRAGLNRATFFRHFADKREVVLAGEDHLVRVFSEAIRRSPDGMAPAGCLEAGLAAAAAAVVVRGRSIAQRRVVVVAASPELQERGQLKYRTLAGAVADALRERGVDDLTAQLSAEVGLLAFRVAFARWLSAEVEVPFPDLAQGALLDLTRRTADLGSAVVAPPDVGSIAGSVR